MGVNLAPLLLHISWKTNRQYQFNGINLLKPPIQNSMKANKLSWHDRLSTDGIRFFLLQENVKKSPKIDENRSYWRRKSSYFPNGWEISMILPGTLSPNPTRSSFDRMLRRIISRYSMITLRHIHNPDKYVVLQISTRNSYFSLDWSAITWHSFRLLLSISFGQI